MDVSTQQKWSSGRWGARRRSAVVVWSLAGGATVGGGLAGCHPTGSPGVDELLAGLAAGLLTLATSRARRLPTLVVAAAALALSRGWVYAPAALAVVAALVAVFARRRHQRLGALVGALASQALLRWPAVGFHGSTALAAGVVFMVASTSAYRQLARRARRRARWTAAGVVLTGVACTVPAVLAALSARSAASAAIADAQQSLRSFGSTPAAQARVKLRSATAELRTAHDRAGAWYTAGAQVVPVVAQNRRALTVATAAAERLTSAASTDLAAVDFSDLGYHGGAVDLSRIASLQRPVAALAAQLDQTQSALRSITSPWLAAPIAHRVSGLSRQLTGASHTAHLAGDAATALPSMLGGDGTRHYLVALETPAEARGLDGLIADYAELTFTNGRVTLTAANSVSPLDAKLPAGGAHLDGPPDFLARYGSFAPGTHLQDASFSPDLPTVGAVLAQEYPQAGGDRIDGVLALDTAGIAALLRVTGPIAVPGVAAPLTAANAADYLNRQQYIDFAADEGTGRHDVLQAALQLAFSRLLAGNLPGPAALSADLGPAVRAGRIMFWSAHPPDATLVADAGLAGAFPRVAPGTDVVAVTTQNADNNKIDAYLSRGVTDHISVDPPSGNVVETLTIALHNAAPTVGLPPYVIGAATATNVPSGDNRTYLTVYSPLALDGASRDGAPLHLAPGQELGEHTYSVNVDVPAADTVTVTVVLRGRLAPGSRLTVSYRDQPTAIDSSQRIEVDPVGSWKVSGNRSWQPAPGSTGSRTFTFVRR